MLEDSFALLQRHRGLIRRREQPTEVPFVIAPIVAAWNADPQLRPHVADLLREAAAVGDAYIEAVTPLLRGLNRVWQHAGNGAPQEEAWQAASRVMTRTQGGEMFAEVRLERGLGAPGGPVAEQHAVLKVLVDNWVAADPSNTAALRLVRNIEAVEQKLDTAAQVLGVQARLPPVAMARLARAALLLPASHVPRTPYADYAPDEVAGQTGPLRVRATASADQVRAVALTEDSGLQETGALKILSRSLLDDLVDVIDELEARLGSVRSRLAVVDRFAWRAERYDRTRLRAIADAAPGRPEAALRDEFARYLFDQGLMPLTEVPGSTTRSDILDLHSGPPLAVEAKQYKEGGKSTLEQLVIEAYWQIVDTVKELTAVAPFDEAFVVVFRRKGSQLILPTAPVRLGGLNFYFRSVDLAESTITGSGAASSPVELTAEDIRRVVADNPGPADPAAE